ncbi:MAG: cyclic nucleotide-binding domain-containing protein [Rhodocyclaceae bacterium]|nr:cyclic nucleotide-binding domain-containing protein [Rhodocyclaceae bacterium]
MSPGSLGKLQQICQVDTVQRGEDLLKHGEWSGRVIYLVRGELKLDYLSQDLHHVVMVVVGGSGRALLPLWSSSSPVRAAHRANAGAPAEQPVQMQAITDCQLISIDEPTMDLVVTWDQMAQELHTSPTPLAGAGGASLEQSLDAPEWQNLSGLCADQSLVSSAFANVPAANISRLIASFKRLEVARGDEIIRQGDDGDYYYLIERGRCRVTREIGGAPTQIAELSDGDAFGDDALVSSAKRNATVSMKTDGILWRLAKEDFLTLLQEPLLRRLTYSEATNGDLADAVWLDTRFPVEFRENGIPGAINIPLNEIRDAASVLDKKREYIVYCQTGRRSSAAAFLLSQRGIRAYLLDGGLSAMNELQELSV